MAKQIKVKRKRESEDEEQSVNALLIDLKTKCPTLFDLLDEFNIDKLFSMDRFENDNQYWHFEELKFFLSAIKFQSTAAAFDIILKRGESEVLTCDDKEQSMILRSTVTTLISMVEEKIDSMLQTPMETTQSNTSTTPVLFIPRIVRLGGPEYFNMKKIELELLKGLVLKTWSRFSTDMFSLGGDQDDAAANEVIMKMVRMNRLELEEFSEDDRKHIEDATVVVTSQEWRPGKIIKVGLEVVRALTGMPLTKEMELKLSGTKVLELLRKERKEKGETTSLSIEKTGADTSESSVLDSVSPAVLLEDNGEEREDGEGEEENSLMEGDEPDSLSPDYSQLSSSQMLARNEEEDEGDGLGSLDKLEVDSMNMKPYTNNLEYLDDCFKVLREQIKLSQIWENDDMKSTGADHVQKYSWDKQAVPKENKHELEAKVKINTNKIDLRIEFTKQKIREEQKVNEKNQFGNEVVAEVSDSMLKKTEDTADMFSNDSKPTKTNSTSQTAAKLPSIYELRQFYRLDSFEHSVLILLIAHSVAPTIRKLYSSSSHRSEMLTVKQSLNFFCETFKDQVEKRPRFYKNSRLLKCGMIKLTAPSWGSCELGECQIGIDRKILETALGLTTEISEVVDGSNLYFPTASMDSVILPKEQKNLILQTVSNFEKFKLFRKRQHDAFKTKALQSLNDEQDKLNKQERSQEHDEIVLPGDIPKEQALSSSSSSNSQGSGSGDIETNRPMSILDSGLVVLLCGPSGTGKTLTVNAVANLLKKRVLMVNFQVAVEPAMRRGARNMDPDSASMPDLISLFREAETHDAVLFFDECESLFAARGQGGNIQTTALLTEMEKYNGLVFLATNRQFDLDEAMHRRIHYVFNFRQPDHVHRKLIWQLHTTEAILGCEVPIDISKNIKWDEIALRYELSGGFIKNAILSSLMLAISRDSEKPCILEEDIHSGCTVQMRGALQMRQFDSRCVPSHGLPSLILANEVAAPINEVVMFEKARSVLFGEWGYGDIEEDVVGGGGGEGGGGMGGMGDQQGTTVMLWGGTGVGKNRIAEAIGFEIGKPLKLVNFSLAMAEQPKQDMGTQENAMMGSASSSARSIFDDARLMQAVVVLDRFDVGCFALERDVLSAAADDFLYHMERFPGMVILLVSADIHISMAIHKLHPKFLNSLKFMIDIPMPTSKERLKLWKRSLPKKCPVKVTEEEFIQLSQRFKLSGGGINKAAYRAAASVALKPVNDVNRVITFKDLEKAADMEKNKGEGEATRLYSQQFL